MRKLYVLWLALVAVFAFGVFTASSALASELLANGNTITSGEDLTAVLKGELLLEDKGIVPTPPDILCKGIFDVLIENGTSSWVNEVLNESGVKTTDNTLLELGNLATSGDALECSDMAGVCSGTVLIDAIHLPWHLELELLAGDAEEPYMLDFLEEAGKIPAYVTDCVAVVGGFLSEDVCDGLVYASLLEPMVGDVTGEFLPVAEGNCSIGGSAKGVLEGESLLEDTTAGVTFSLS